jgi:hypothetical protein
MEFLLRPFWPNSWEPFEHFPCLFITFNSFLYVFNTLLYTFVYLSIRYNSFTYISIAL